MSVRLAVLLENLLEEQRKTNQLLVMLVQALADESDDDAEPQTYMDGTPVDQGS